MAVNDNDRTRPLHGSPACTCLFCWGAIKELTAERDASRLIINDLTAEVERLRAAGDALATALRAMTRLAAPPDMDEWVAWQLGVADPALAAFKEARRD